MYILGIETSCDETAASVVEDGRTVLSDVIASSVDEQALYGGIVPEIASRRHIESISAVAQKALQNACLPVSKLDGIAVTCAPGLIGALLVGVNFAKGLAFSANKPLIPVHHLRGHVASLYLTHKTLAPPFLCLIASGGHCHIVLVQDYTKFRLLGRTLDDAPGEAFDKVARTLSLGYPGGPAIANAALQGDANAYSLPTPKAAGEFNVSFSGLKTAVLNIVNNAKMKNEVLDVNGLAAAFQQKTTEILCNQLLLCAKKTGMKTICIAGGVAANNLLRETLQKKVAENSTQLLFPQRGFNTPSLRADKTVSGAQTPLLAAGSALHLPALNFCGDNAAMIASQGFYELQNGALANATLNGFASWPIDEPFLF